MRLLVGIFCTTVFAFLAIDASEWQGDLAAVCLWIAVVGCLVMGEDER